MTRARVGWCRCCAVYAPLRWSRCMQCWRFIISLRVLLWGVGAVVVWLLKEAML